MMTHMEHRPSPAGDNIVTVIGHELTAANMSLRELATATSIPATTLHRRMARGGSFLVPELEAICDVLDLDLADLFSRARAA